MATTLGGGFNFLAKELADSRFIITASNERFGFEQARMGIGLTTYASESRQYFILTDSSSYTSNAGWSTIPISDLNNTSSFTFVSTSITTASITSASIGAVDLPLWGDLSHSLSQIKESAGSQDLQSVTGLGNVTNTKITASSLVASSSAGGGTTKPFLSLRHHVLAPESGESAGQISFRKNTTSTTNFGDFATIQLQYTRKVGLFGGDATQPTGSAALVFKIAPSDGGFRSSAGPYITPLILSGSTTDPRAEFHSTDFTLNGSGYASRAPKRAVVISGGSGSTHPPYISPDYLASSMNFGSGSAGYTLDFNNNIARFGGSFISGSETGISILKFHSSVHEFKHSSPTSVKIEGSLSASKIETGLLTGSKTLTTELTSSNIFTINVTASGDIKLGSGAVSKPGLTEGTSNFLKIIGTGSQFTRVESHSPPVVEGAMMYSESAFYLGLP